MSSAVLVKEITAISYRFAVKWSIPVKKLEYEPSTSNDFNPRIIKSNIYRFKDINNLEFSYRLICGENDYEMAVSCKIGLPIFQDDALILIKDRIYRVKCNPTNTATGLIFKPLILAQNWFQGDKVTFHCIMSIPAKIKAVIPNPEEELTVNIVECESILSDPGVHPYGYDDVSEFQFSSRIPDFNEDMAVRMIREAHQRHYPILKALCLEYLMENLTIENVFEVLKQSVDCDAKDLSQKCVEFISAQCQLVPLSKICTPNRF